MKDVQDITSPMNPTEKRASYSLAAIYALRMLGLFMLLPVISLFAEKLEGSTPVLIGLAISIYGLSQAVLQIPFGLMSDKYGRKTIITIGLFLFVIGSLIAAFSTSIYGVIIGRAVQGSGAIAAAVMALAADLTHEVHRTKAMALIGISIGLSFGVSIVLGPIVAGQVGLTGLFILTAVLAIAAMFVLHVFVPNPEATTFHRDTQWVSSQFKNMLANYDLLRLDFGIFILHLILTASFTVVPLVIREAGLVVQQHGWVYLPTFMISMAAVVPFIIYAEKKHQMKRVLTGAILTLSLANFGLYLFSGSWSGLIIFLMLFFCGFNLLEATLPSLISKIAPPDKKGTAMGIYSTSQFLGAFAGGSLAGLIHDVWGLNAVFLMSSIMAGVWLLVVSTMNEPRYFSNMLVKIPSGLGEQQAQKDLLSIHGIMVAIIQKEENVAYLKVDKEKLATQHLQQLLLQWGNT